ncbi:SPARC-related modular calcium-binding protein 1 isoform X2 [Xenopus tropicalis]|uniref:SPARC-related modular calcium-binding protein 1 isoform X2 n=1 Tax=Xenopus tropicalis TaxID=8364 RepID=A0A8J0SKA8_XENTR|nr:SPARC-related modular calcium-binding protein 1 isoform X2 [Xenopus tropicalis]|eukprot:XP_012823494.1 PREDICTED: SPARC-related modular calcium-binding protein 1 isoform X2 [Xenopus tropicalis]
MIPRVIALFVTCHFVLLHLPQCCGQRATGPRFLISDRDRDPQCNPHCTRPQHKPVCASDGRTYESMCDYQRAKCKDATLSVTHRGRCKDAGQSKCRLERTQALEQAKKPQEAVFIPECNEDGSFTQVQCHTFTGYCWCVTPDGKPVSGSSVQNKTPVCSGSVTEKPSSQGNSGRRVSFRFFLTLNSDDGSKPTPTVESRHVFEGDGRRGPHPILRGEIQSSDHPSQNVGGGVIDITAPTLWIKHLVIKDAKLNSSSVKHPANSCDQERQSALEEAKLNPRDGIVIPECAPGGLYKPVQCHQSTGYCWCVLVDTGRPLPGTSTRYETPVCESDARWKNTDAEDPFKDRELAGCPEGKKLEFITSLLDALTTDMVQAINSAAPAAGGRFSEPDPNHTLEERVVLWYFSQLDSNGSEDINKKEMKPFKRYVKKKAKPKKCARRFTDYCDLNKDKSISFPELKGCLGVRKEPGANAGSFPPGKRPGSNPFSRLV